MNVDKENEVLQKTLHYTEVRKSVQKLQEKEEENKQIPNQKNNKEKQGKK